MEDGALVAKALLTSAYNDKMQFRLLAVTPYLPVGERGHARATGHKIRGLISACLLPVHWRLLRATKLSTVLGTTSPYRPRTTRPAGLPPIERSKNTFLVTAGSPSARALSKATHAERRTHTPVRPFQCAEAPELWCKCMRKYSKCI